MRIVAIKSFRNKETQEIYSPGDVVSAFTEARANDVVARGLAVVLNEKTLGPVILNLSNDGVITYGGTTDATAPANTGTIAGEKDIANTGAADDIDMTQQWQKVVAAVKTFEDVEKLKDYLATENSTDKPRASVVVALEVRIAELSNKA